MQVSPHRRRERSGGMASFDTIRGAPGHRRRARCPAWCASSAPRIQGEAVSAILGELPATFASFLTQFPREGNATVRLSESVVFLDALAAPGSKSLHDEGHREVALICV